jgi:hypothetical protein
MIRFAPLKDPSSGIPYVNTDFTSVLQDEHLKAYRSILDGINYGSTSSSEPLNSGIVLSGLKINSADASSYNLNILDSVVYIDGEFYKEDPSDSPLLPYVVSSATFYIIPSATSSELRTLPVDTITTTTASNTRYFQITTSLPTQPYIKFSNKGTSRRYRRILKYFTSKVGDVYISKSKINFDNNGVGFNDMEGFVVLDDNSGIAGMPNLSGKFIRGWTSGATLGGFGGSDTHSVTKQEMASHFHSTNQARIKQNWATPGVSSYADLEHYHYLNTSRFVRDVYDFAVPTDLSLGKDPTNPTQFVSPDSPNPDDPTIANLTTGSVFGRRGAIYTGTVYFTGGVHKLQQSELQTHKHAVAQSDFGDGNPNNPGAPHENRPEYYVVVFYTKKPN